MLGLRACGVRPGDEVIVPAFTFVATAGAVSALGARPVFADIEPDTLNLSAAVRRHTHHQPGRGPSSSCISGAWQRASNRCWSSPRGIACR